MVTTINFLQSPQGGAHTCPYVTYEECFSYFELRRRQVAQNVMGIGMNSPFLNYEIDSVPSISIVWELLLEEDDFFPVLSHTLATCSVNREMESDYCKGATSLALQLSDIENYCLEYVSCALLRHEHYLQMGAVDEYGQPESLFCSETMSDRAVVCEGGDFEEIPGYDDYRREKGRFGAKTKMRRSG